MPSFSWATLFKYWKSRFTTMMLTSLNYWYDTNEIGEISHSWNWQWCDHPDFYLIYYVVWLYIFLIRTAPHKAYCSIRQRCNITKQQSLLTLQCKNLTANVGHAVSRLTHLRICCQLSISTIITSCTMVKAQQRCSLKHTSWPQSTVFLHFIH